MFAFDAYIAFWAISSLYFLDPSMHSHYAFCSFLTVEEMHLHINPAITEAQMIFWGAIMYFCNFMPILSGKNEMGLKERSSTMMHAL